MGKHSKSFDELNLSVVEYDEGRVDETAADPTMIAQGLRLHRAFMSISDAAHREAVINFAIDRAGKRAELHVVHS